MAEAVIAHGRSEAVSPAVDVVIPTFNCARNLETCLSRLDAQLGRDGLRVIVVDAGSTDGTREVASAHGAQVLVNPGQYGTGKNGARHFGEVRGDAPFVWYVDSDNFLLETTVLHDLLEPMRRDPSLMLAVPETAIDAKARSIGRWLAKNEIEHVERAKRKGDRSNGYWVVPNFDYGLPNSVLIRRSAMEAVGGYDSDVRMLLRLRRAGLARAAIVPTAHFYHNEANSPVEFLRKMNRRVTFFGKLTDQELKEFFVEYPIPSESHQALMTVTVRDRLSTPVGALRNFLRTGEADWLWGAAYPFLLGLLVVRHPLLSRRVLSDVI
jgi:glycosyltransferase involved in cell wall biosynthesis